MSDGLIEEAKNFIETSPDVGFAIGLRTVSLYIQIQFEQKSGVKKIKYKLIKRSFSL
jgi:hypothetical protein